MSVESNHAAIRTALLDWYRRHARSLPWRAPPGANARPDPYRVWLSEIMLQQTTVAAVAPYFDRFTSRWPTLADLAAADSEDVLAAWAGLGYYSRARNLIACAAAVVRDHGGAFPADEAQLRALPGIGDYTAAAIAGIAFGLTDAVPVDANIERVVARLFVIDTPLPAGRAAIRTAARALWPIDGSGGDFAQAMMDLGSTLCTARTADCLLCPVSPHCAGRKQGIALSLPVKPAKKIKPVRQGRALWIERDKQVWLIRRPAKGMLGGMRALPGSEWRDSPVAVPPATNAVGQFRHIFTHFALDLSVDRSSDASLAVGEGVWWPIDRLDEAGLPTLYRRAAELALGE
jgi:A/G-specific adenine glycosylase